MKEASGLETLPSKIKAEGPTRRRLVLNYISQLLNQLIRICEQLLLVPLFLAAWGPEIYKDWVVLYAIMVFLSLCNFGMGAYFGNRFIELIARDDREAFRRELTTALFCTLCVGIFVLVAAYSLFFGFGRGKILTVAGLSETTADRCLLLMTLPTAVGFYMGTLHSIYRALGEFTRGEFVYAIYASVQMVAVALVLVARLPPTAAASVYLVMPALLWIGIIVDLRSRHSNIALGLRVPSLTDLQRILRQSLLFFTSPLSQALVQSGPVMLFGVLGVPAVPVLSYTLTRTFTGLTRQAANQFAIGSGIEMARYRARGQDETCRRLYEATGRIVTTLVGLFAGFTVWAAAPFLGLWTHGTVQSNLALVLCFLAGMFVAAPGQAALMLLNFTNIPRPLALAWCGQAFCGLALSAALVPMFGVTAAAFCFAVAESIAVGLCLPIVVQRHFGFSAARYLLRSFALGTLGFGWSAFVAELAFELGLSGFKGFALTAVLWGGVAIPPFALLVLPPQHRRAILSRIRGIAARFA